MISVYRFRQNFNALFRIMISTDMYVDVSYKGRGYRVRVEDLNMAVKQRKGGSQKTTAIFEGIEDETCQHCGKLMLAGVCMNSVCPSSRAVSPPKS